MREVLKNIGIVILSIIIGMITNIGLIIIGGTIFPLSENFNPMNAINWDFKYFIFPPNWIYLHSGEKCVETNKYIVGSYAHYIK